MISYYAHVEAALRATIFHSKTTFSWFGERSPQLPAAIRHLLPPITLRDYLIFNLQHQLYSDFYCQGFAMPSSQKGGSFFFGRTPFTEALSEANAGHDTWEDNWEVRAITDEYIVVRREGLELRAHPETCSPQPGGSITLDARVQLHLPKERLYISPGFYLAVSDQPLVGADAQTLVRFYWNLTIEGAIPFVRLTTSLLNHERLPFRLKVLNAPEYYPRCDAGVIYALKKDYNQVADILKRIYAEVCAYLRCDTPVFTKSLAWGVGLAEDPGEMDSFGLHRCRLLADGMICAYEQGNHPLEQRLHVVVNRFERAGISLEEPFLNPGSRDIYSFQSPYPKRIYISYDPITAPRSHMDTEVYLRTATAIGRRLVREAVWYQDQCNWLGAETTIHPSSYEPPGEAYRALGPDLYNGTSGVALFLGQLYTAVNDPTIRRAAIGAINQALSYADTIAPLGRLGLYTGWPGIAFAAARLGLILGEESLLERARQLSQRIVLAEPDPREFDLLSGSAGAIVGLVTLAGMLDSPPFFDAAVRLGDELLRSIGRGEVGNAWTLVSDPMHCPLTGFSHGAAGVGFALLELFHVTRDERHRAAAEQAFQYERSWFGKQAGNWPDLRHVRARRSRRNRSRSFMTTWCHGAPGIALSRLRAYELIGDETCKAEATIALRTTHAATEQALRSETGNFSLCHGLAGNAEVLRYGHQLLAEESTDAALLPYRIGDAVIERYAMRGDDTWRCGTGGGETPGFMLGLAGIGYYYLRLHDSAIPLILILQREQFLAPYPGASGVRSVRCDMT
jgi:hypothetical protein